MFNLAHFHNGIYFPFHLESWILKRKCNDLHANSGPLISRYNDCNRSIHKFSAGICCVFLNEYM